MSHDRSATPLDHPQKTSLERAVIMARGLGTRMRREAGASPLSADQAAAAATGVKAMIPIGRPFLDYVLSALAEAGFRRVCLVIGPEHDQIRSYYTQTLRPARLTVDFAIQERPLGTADAVAAAREWAGDEPFAVLNSDNYYPVAAYRALRALDGPGLIAFTREGLLRGGDIPPERVSQYALLRLDGADRLVEIIEKPDPAAWTPAPADRVSMNLWRFGPAIFTACRQITPSPRGELELVDAVRYARDVLGETFQARVLDAPVLDLSSRADIAGVAERLSGAAVAL